MLIGVDTYYRVEIEELIEYKMKKDANTDYVYVT